MRAGGCPECAKEIRNNKILERRNTLYKKYIENAKIIHRNKYDYSKIDTTLPVNKYENEIICPIHGIFKQSISHHANGAGCPLCAEELKESIAASRMKNIILNNNEIPIAEYRIQTDYLKNKPYDIFIKCFNLLVEVQGPQHSEKRFLMTDDDFLKRKEIDKNKKSMALENGYNFLEIKKTDNLKLIDKIIADLISSTTIEIFESKITKYDSNKVEYTHASGNREHEKSEDIV